MLQNDVLMHFWIEGRAVLPHPPTAHQRGTDLLMTRLMISRTWSCVFSDAANQRSAVPWYSVIMVETTVKEVLRVHIRSFLFSKVGGNFQFSWKLPTKFPLEIFSIQVHSIFSTLNKSTKVSCTIV